MTTSAPVDHIQIEPREFDMEVGQTRDFTARVFDIAGNPLSGRRVEWVSGNESVVAVYGAPVRGVAQVRAVGVGSATVIATAEGVSARISVAVTAPEEPESHSRVHSTVNFVTATHKVLSAATGLTIAGVSLVGGLFAAGVIGGGGDAISPTSTVTPAETPFSPPDFLGPGQARLTKPDELPENQSITLVLDIRRFQAFVSADVSHALRDVVAANVVREAGTNTPPPMSTITDTELSTYSVMRALLDAPAFDFNQTGWIEQPFPEDNESVTWTWTVIPKAGSQGSHEITVKIDAPGEPVLSTLVGQVKITPSRVSDVVPTETPTPTPTPTATPTVSTLPAATPTLAPPPTPRPTVMPTSTPAPTRTPAPTATVFPTPTPTPAPTATATPPFPDKIFVDLGVTNKSEGLLQVDSSGDGITLPSLELGRECRVTVFNGTSGRFVYFKVDDGFIFAETTSVEITIEYFDSRDEVIQLQYDSSDPSAIGGGVFKIAGTVNLGDTNTWKSDSFVLSDAFFANRQQGDFDFRLGVGNAEVCISGVTVTKTTAPDTVAPVFTREWGTEGSGDGQFNSASRVAIDPSGNVYVVDIQLDRVQKFSATGAFLTKWGTEGTGAAQFDNPEGIAVDADGNVYVADLRNHRIQKFTPDGAFFLTEWGTFGTANGQFDIPTAIAIDASGIVYVTDRLNSRIQKFTADGGYLGKWGGFGVKEGQFDAPTGIAVDSSGNVYVADRGNNRIQKFDTNGLFITEWGTLGTGDGQFAGPADVATDSSGNVYIVEQGNHRVQKFTPDGVFLAKWGSLGDGDGQFDAPFGLAVDSSGTVFVADSLNFRIQVFAPAP